MPKYYCDYCDVFLTHDSSSVRKAHNSGRNHLTNVREYYASLGHDKAQNIIDEITKMYENGAPPPRMPLPPQPNFGGRGPPPPFMGGPSPFMSGPPPGQGFPSNAPPPGFGPPPPFMGPPGSSGSSNGFMPPPQGFPQPTMSAPPSGPPLGFQADGGNRMPPPGMNPERARALGLV